MIAYLLLLAGPWAWLGVALMWTGLFALLWVFIDTFGGVHLGPDPVMPAVIDAITEEITPVSPAAANWTPWAEFVADVDETTAAVIDLTVAVEMHPIAFDVSAPTEVIDYEAPLFYQIRRPKPYDGESFTRGWNREQLDRAIEAGRPL